MRYWQINNGKTEFSYRVTDGGEKAAEFCWHIEEYAGETDKGTERTTAGETVRETGSGTDRGADRGTAGGRFWLDEVRLAGRYAHYECMYAVLKFICYKCWSAGFSAVYLRISGRNLFYMELYKKFGFYVIAEEMRKIHKDISGYEYVMKYPLPQNREEEYDHYIRRK